MCDSTRTFTRTTPIFGKPDELNVGDILVAKQKILFDATSFLQTSKTPGFDIDSIFIVVEASVSNCGPKGHFLGPDGLIAWGDDWRYVWNYFDRVEFSSNVVKSRSPSCKSK